MTAVAEEVQSIAGAEAVLRTAVAGVSGYAGAELARLLLSHPRLQGATPLFLGRAEEGSGTARTLYELHPQLAVADRASSPAVVPFDFARLAAAGTEVLFLATPHEQSRALVPAALERGLRVIDLSGAWRLRHDEHRSVYGFDDSDTPAAVATQQMAVYGCPELHREQIRTARLVANPGCYANSIVLALAPLLRAGMADLDRGIVCDAKSGVSGAGKAATAKTHFMYAADNLSAYGVFGHRHTGELLEQLSLDESQIQFTPHLLPIPRGILSTIYVTLRERTTAEQVQQRFEEFYSGSPMVRLHATPSLPQIQHVVRTSFCDIGFVLHADGRRLVLVSCLDNLLKGAAGQAVQNLNVMKGWAEAEGLQ